MLGRYIAGTLLVLGGAMLVAPDLPTRRTAQVTRSTALPSQVAAPPVARAPERVPEAVAAADTVAAATEASAATERRDAGIEDAVMAALALDTAETAAAGSDTAGLDESPMEALADPADQDDLTPGQIRAAESDSTAPVWQGLGSLGSGDAEPLDATAITPAVTHYVTGTRVNLRAGPSTDYRVVGTVGEGDAVELLSGGADTWARVRLSDSDTTGFMARRFLAPAPGDG